MQTTVSTIQGYLEGIDYPASKSEIIDQARNNGAPEEVTESLGTIEDRSYNSPTDLMESISYNE